MTLRTFLSTSFASFLGFLGLTSTVAAALLIAHPSAACWDGVYVETPRVTLTSAELGDQWTPQLARDVGLWVARVEAFLPDDVLVTVQHGVIEICGVDGNEDFGCVEPDDEWSDGELATLFAAVARAAGVDDATKQRAKQVSVSPQTVQLGVFRSKRAAHRYALTATKALEDVDTDLFGYLEAGAFPADNAFVHVVESRSSRTNKPRYRVVTGAFIDPAEARLTAAQIKAATNMKVQVRSL